MSPFRPVAYVSSLVVACLCSSLPAFARVSESDDTLVGRSEHSFIKRLADEGICNPGELAGSEVIVLIRGGAAYEEVDVLGPVRSDAKVLAAIVESWAKSAGDPDPDVRWSQENDYAAASYSRSTSAFMAQNGEMKIAYGSLVAALRRSGLKPAAGLTRPLYSTMSGKPLGEGWKGRTTALYIVSSASEGDAVTLSASVTPAQKGLFWLFCSGVPAVALISFLFAIVYAKNDRIPLDQRRRRYPSLVKYPTFGAIGLHFPFAMFFLFGGGLRAPADLWFGTWRSSVFAPFLFFPLPVLLGALALTMPVERRLFSEPGTPDRPRLTRFGGTSLRSRSTLGYVIIIVGLGLSLWGISIPGRSNRGIGMAMQLIGLGLMFSSSWIAGRLVGRKADDTVLRESEDPFVQRVEAWAGKRRVVLRGVNIVEPSGPPQSLDLVLHEGVLTVPRRAIDELSEGELDTAIVRALSDSGLSWRLLALPMVVVVPLAIAFGWLTTTDLAWISGNPWIRPAAIIVSLAGVFATTPRLMRKSMGDVHTRAYVDVLKLTRDPSSARSYESKRVRLFLSEAGQDRLSKRAEKLVMGAEGAVERAISIVGME